MTIQDTFLKTRALRAITLQEEGKFIVDHRHELPLPGHRSLANLHYSHAADEFGRYYDYETEWGKFSFDPETRTILVLRQGEPPGELVPQPKLALATATLHTGFVTVHNNGSSFEMDFPTRDRLVRINNPFLAANFGKSINPLLTKVPPILSRFPVTALMHSWSQKASVP